MNAETLELLELIAERLGITSETLIGWFAVLAPYEFFDPVILLAVGGFLGIGAISAWKRITLLNIDKDFMTDQGYTYFIIALVCGLCCFTVILAGLIEFGEAIRAVISPNAFALSKILELF